MLDKAVHQAAAKNDMSKCSSPPRSDFNVLSAASDSHLLSVASDVGLVLAMGSSPSSFLSLVRAKEIAQASLAIATAKAAATAAARAADKEAAASVAPPPSVGDQRLNASVATAPNTDPPPSAHANPVNKRKRPVPQPPHAARVNLRATPTRLARMNTGDK
jgi:hypothetical protein